MRLRHVSSGVVLNVRDGKAGLGAEWEPVDGHATAPADDRFDPGKWNVDDVTAYLADADDAERARVLEAEAAGKARKSIAEWEPAPADDE